MKDSKVFHKSILGANHIKLGKPCQDCSNAYQDDDMIIVVVCDGHGGSTYFRSDIGAKYATDITIQLLKDFAKHVPSTTFDDISFSITAQPQRNPFLDVEGNKLRFEELNDDQKKLALQAQSFLESKEKYCQQQNIINDLLSIIHQNWMNEIVKDVRNNPFSRKEAKVLSGLGIEKAYGCTLLAFLQTKEYWLAFHIGDGRISFCDNSLNWVNPVPEDCTCFLNYTTSLCDSNPLIEFRYAFNGKDDSPLAVMLCSDGLDGSLRTDNNLQDFYEQIIGLCIDDDDVEKELESYLPTLSESGNKDDISLAGFVSLSDFNKETIRKRIELKKRYRIIDSEYTDKKNGIEDLYSKIEILKIKYDRLKDEQVNKRTELEEMSNEIKNKEKEVMDLDKTVMKLKNEIETLDTDLNNKIIEFNNWEFTIKNEKAEIQFALDENTNNNKNNNHTGFTW